MLENVKFNLERFLVSVCREKYLCQLFFLSGSKNRLRKYPYSFSHTGNGPICFAAALPSRPVCNHLHARNSTKVNLSHHQLLLPWEPKQRSPSSSCTEAFSHFLTCLQFKQSLAGAAEKGSRQHPALITELSLTHTHTNWHCLFPISSFSLCQGSGQTMCKHVAHVAGSSAMSAILSPYNAALRSGHFCIACHTSVLTTVMMSLWEYGDINHSISA